MLALKGMVVRGEIRTAVEYLVQLLETEDFKSNNIDTSWLDGIIKEKSIAMKEDPHTIVASAVLYRAFRMVQAEEAAFKEFWQKGQTATQGVERLTEFPMEITYQDIKYSFTEKRRGPDSLLLSLGGEDVIDAYPRALRRCAPWHLGWSAHGSMVSRSLSAYAWYLMVRHGCTESVRSF